MDEVYMTKMAEAFLSELSEIEKEAWLRQAGQAILGAARKGASGVSGALQRVGTAPMGTTTMGRVRHVVGGPEVVQAGGFRKFFGEAAKKGREAAMKEGKSGTWGAVRGVAGTQPFQTMATVAAPVAAGAGLGYAMS